MSSSDSKQDMHGKDGQFTRTDSAFRNFISRNSNARFPAEKGRYALYFSPGCPWAHRTLIVRALKGLEDYIDAYQLHHKQGPDGWYFSGEGGSLAQDPLHGFKTLRESYRLADPEYDGRITVPALWDKTADTLVSNESADIIRMLYTEFDDLLPEHLREANKPGGGLYPEHLRKEIDEMNSWVYDTVNNGVYKVGFAKQQDAYDEHVEKLFASLDRLEEHLASAGTPFLFGTHVTEADVRLWTTIARFDTAYVPVFQCNLGTIRNDYPRLHLWLRRLYWDGSERGEDLAGEAWKGEAAAAEPGSLRGAFYRTTKPFVHLYRPGYAEARRKVVLGRDVPVIVPAGPRTPILGLD